MIASAGLWGFYWASPSPLSLSFSPSSALSSGLLGNYSLSLSTTFTYNLSTYVRRHFICINVKYDKSSLVMILT
ncbi:hypothetical protein LguiA_025139 [Lonicera macranthoides]